MSLPASTFATIILAAGQSSRLRQFKPLLPLGGKPMLEHLITRYQSCGITNIRVVAGHRANEVMALSCRLGAEPILNANHADGMWSSVVAGISELSSTIAGVFIHPVDIPLVRRQTLRDILAAFRPGTIVYPTFQQERGHPPLIDAGYLNDLVAWNGQGGLRCFLAGYEDRAIAVPVADRFILKDIDEPEDYRWAENGIDRYDIPSADECSELMASRLNVPHQVVAHCRTVAALAESIGKALVDTGCPLDIERIVCAALVHDLARSLPDHARIGAALLREMDFPRLADIVAVHMDFSVNLDAPISEAEVVFLADKLVEEDHVVDIKKRFRDKLNRYVSNPAARESDLQTDGTSNSIPEAHRSADRA